MHIMTDTSKKKRIQSDKKGRTQGFYLGTEPERVRRLAALTQAAKALGFDNPSVTLQGLADGTLIAVALGDSADAGRRRERLEALAAERGVTLSVLIRQLADGEIKIVE